MKSLKEIHEEQQGKSSDKWSLYLKEYDKALSAFRGQRTSLLEIGIQNGGSLEVWSKYFPQARCIVGCDINPTCSNLSYDDKRIAIVIGDANRTDTYREIMRVCDTFDIVIDDGSHHSSDIIRSFLLYFPRISDGGVFIAEDLHCSYWGEFEGGLYHPFSSISFFKRLVDVINREHWGVAHDVSSVLRSISNQYGLSIDSTILASIRSVKFVNSLCIIEKGSPADNVLGPRNVSGGLEEVVSGNLSFNGSLIEVIPQDDNLWSADKTPEEKETEARQENIELRAEVESLAEMLGEAQRRIELMVRSRSWRLTAPLRAINRAVGAGTKSQAPTHHVNVNSPVNSSSDIESLALREAVGGLLSDDAPDPAFQALSGLHIDDANDKGIIRDKSKLIAFYLPQFHKVKENSEWWGPGFTEWTNTSRGRPNFEGHIQPHIPRDLGYYDLSKVDVMYDQVQMAKEFGLYGFCFYYYWFSGRRILETPVNNFLSSDIDFPFCLCWANENWTRTWDGKEQDVLLEQKYAEGDEERLIESLMPFFNDRRYIKVDGKPLFIVYRIKQLPEPCKSIQRWKKAAQSRGLKGLHVSVVDFYDINDPLEVCADALIEFPPHKFNGPENRPYPGPRITNPKFCGSLVDYTRMIVQSASREQPEYRLYRGIIPGWDNTARRQDSGTIVVGSTPELYGAWLSYLRAFTRKSNCPEGDNFIFVNAWNEWGEGCHLEPDMYWGTRFLEETKRSSWYDSRVDAAKLTESRRILFSKIQTLLSASSAGYDSVASAYRQPSSFVRRTASVLRRFPLVHRLGKATYLKLMGR